MARSAGSGFSIAGMDELRAALGQLSGVPGELVNQLAEVAEDIAANARTRVPVVSGALKGSIQVERDGDTVRVLVGGAAAPYAGRIHARPKGKGKKFLRLASLRAVRQWRAKSPLAQAIHERKRAKRKAFAKAGGFRRKRLA